MCVDVTVAVAVAVVAAADAAAVGGWPGDGAGRQGCPW